jgi:hypothetical protein
MGKTRIKQMTTADHLVTIKDSITIEHLTWYEICILKRVDLECLIWYACSSSSISSFSYVEDNRIWRRGIRRRISCVNAMDCSMHHYCQPITTAEFSQYLGLRQLNRWTCHQVESNVGSLFRAIFLHEPSR